MTWLKFNVFCANSAEHSLHYVPDLSAEGMSASRCCLRRRWLTCLRWHRKLG